MPRRALLSVGLGLAGAVLLTVLLLTGPGEPVLPIAPGSASDGSARAGGPASTPLAVTGGGDAPLAAEGPAPSDADAATDPPARRDGASGAVPDELRTALEQARSWLDERDAARRAGDREAEETARARWDVERSALIMRLQRDTQGAVELLGVLGTWEDEQAALYLARVLPFLWGDGFEAHLIRRVTGGGPVQERRAAMVGLYGRGLRAAVALGEVAQNEEDVVLRADATQHLAGHLTDPLVAPRLNELRATVSSNLEHEDVSVRGAAVMTLAASREKLPADTVEILNRLSSSDPDDRVRHLAAHLLRRQ